MKDLNQSAVTQLINQATAAATSKSEPDNFAGTQFARKTEWGTVVRDRPVPDAKMEAISRDTIVWHEAAHAIVGYRLGMTIHFIDMTGLLIPQPVTGLDVDPVPANERARATGIAALAGPIGETFLYGDSQPNWRLDGEVARASAKALANDTVGQMKLLMGWSDTARLLLRTDPAYRPLVKMLNDKRKLTGEEFLTIVNTAGKRAQ